MRGELFGILAFLVGSGVVIAFFDWFLRALVSENPAVDVVPGERSNQDQQRGLVLTQEELLQVPLSGGQ
jgi:hypothetical protein